MSAILPAQWPAPPQVRALQTTRLGGVSRGVYAQFNLGTRSGDDLRDVEANRRRLSEDHGVPDAIGWLHQVHGTRVLQLPHSVDSGCADAAWTEQPGAVCAVLTADCLPVLLCDVDGRCVAAAHAGWRGLCGGVLEQAVAALPAPPSRLMAWMGAAIGPEAFEVGPEVRERFIAQDPQAATAFAAGHGDRWWCDLYALARQRLQRAGVTQIYGGGLCTYSDAFNWYSYRRDGDCGRMASLIWIGENAPRDAR
jgi:YfiH family protein